MFQFPTNGKAHLNFFSGHAHGMSPGEFQFPTNGKVHVNGDRRA